MRVTKVYQVDKSIELEYSNNGVTEVVSLGQLVETDCENQSEGGGDTALEDGLVEGTFTTYENSRVTQIKSKLFSGQTNIETVSFPNVTTVLGIQTFSDATKLKSASFPKLVKGVPSMFYVCSALKSVYLPLVNYVDTSMFSACGLESLTLPTKCDVYTGAFTGSKSLQIVEFSGGANFLRTNIFKDCAALKTLVIGGNEVATLSYVNTFDGTPFASGGSGGTVYVPSALISSYQSATNWSTLYAAGTCNFVAIEGSEYE